jgi:hypothetical protein
MFIRLTVALLALGATSAKALSISNTTFAGRHCGSSLSATQILEAEALFAQNKFKARDAWEINPLPTTPTLSFDIYLHASTFLS